MENPGRSRDRRHGQTVKARVILFSGGTLTGHLSRLTVKRKEEGREGQWRLFFFFLFFPYLLLDKPDDKALSAHEVTSPLWNWNNSIQSQNKGPWLAYIFRLNRCIPLSSQQ